MQTYGVSQHSFWVASYGIMAAMKLVDRTLPDPVRNLACDEALLELCEAGFDHDILRFWEPREHFVVLGYSSRIRADVELSRAQRLGIPVFRRCSGGGTVLQGPGCLNFSLVLRLAGRPALDTITGTTRHIMRAHQQALAPVAGSEVQVEGLSDLARGGLKFSGNAQRRKRRAVLFHGTFLLNLDLALVAELLPVPSRQPPYRQNRPHQEFLTNLRMPAQSLKEALVRVWQASTPLEALPMKRIEELRRDVYGTRAWTYRS